MIRGQGTVNRGQLVEKWKSEKVKPIDRVESFQLIPGSYLFAKYGAERTTHGRGQVSGDRGQKVKRSYK